jgi:hypothetical protein
MDQPLHGIFQLADVAGPGLLLHAIPNLFVKRFGLLAWFFAELFEKILASSGMWGAVYLGREAKILGQGQMFIAEN